MLHTFCNLRFEYFLGYVQFFKASKVSFTSMTSYYTHIVTETYVICAEISLMVVSNNPGPYSLARAQCYSR